LTNKTISMIFSACCLYLDMLGAPLYGGHIGGEIPAPPR